MVKAGTGTRRRTADERREDVIAAAIIEFATYGLHGASTEPIAVRAGISQPYVLRLFGTKKALFLAAVSRVTDQIFEVWQRGLDDGIRSGPATTPMERLIAMGAPYSGLVMEVNPLRLILQSFSSAEDPDVRALAHATIKSMYEWVRKESGATPEEVRRFMAIGMMLTVAASIQAVDVAKSEPWAQVFLNMPVDEPT